MSELIEINEDNCVLNKNELRVIDKSLRWNILNVEFRTKEKTLNFQKWMEKIFLKINKLNDLAKEQER